MERFIGIESVAHLPSLAALSRRLEEGAFAEARRLDCPFLIEPQTPIHAALISSGLCAGIIGFFLAPPTRRSRRRPFPVVNVSNTSGPLPGVANILSDDVEVGRQAARYLLDLGHRNFLGIGQTGRVFSEQRLRGFESTVRAAGGSVRLENFSGSMPPHRWSPGAYQEEMGELVQPLLAKMPLRAAVFAVSDWLAWPILRLLEGRLAERQDTTAVLGVDNLHDAHFDPRKAAGLSSLVPAFHRIGAEALRTLMEHLDDPEALVRVRRWVPPEGLAERSSTAGRACDDPLTARVARLLWASLREGQAVPLSDLARAHGMSVRTLENKFQRHLGTTARDYLGQLRIDYGKHLLRDADLTVAEVASRCGYNDTAAFSNAFKRVTGRSPRAWREGLATSP